jgi:glycosyltransferase involved in cell wall biosynthesis
VSRPLSVVIAAHNAEDTLGEQLDALTRQDWPFGGEIIVADNGSTDRTAAFAQSYDHPIIDIRTVDASAHKGAGFARNCGVLAAQFHNSAFCDADDVVGESWVTEITRGLDHGPAVGGCLEFTRLNPDWVVGSRGRLVAGEELPLFDGVFPVLSSCNLGIRRDTFLDLGGFDLAYVLGEDAELSLRLHQAATPTTFLPRAVVHYRMRSSLRDIFEQARGWGAVQVTLGRSLHGSARPGNRRSRARSWLWLVAHGHILATRAGRARWAYVAGLRIGAHRGRRLLP